MAKTFETFEEAMAWREPISVSSRRVCLIPVQLRPMRTADLERIMGIEKRAYEFPWTLGMFEDCLQVGYCCWVCEGDQILYGYGIMSMGAGECHIFNLCVAPEFHRQGLGRHIMTHLMHLGQRHHADTIFLEVRSSNQAAIGLYLNMGFNEIGLRRAYYPAHRGREDAVMLAKNL